MLSEYGFLYVFDEHLKVIKLYPFFSSKE